MMGCAFDRATSKLKMTQPLLFSEHDHEKIEYLFSSEASVIQGYAHETLMILHG
jgi:hypothetical protein